MCWMQTTGVLADGLNGRSEKLPDVCYSWWNLPTMAIIGRDHGLTRKDSQRLSCMEDLQIGLRFSV